MPEKWRYKGDHLMSCNCDYGCPCNFNVRPTTGHCEGTLAFRIAEGTSGKTSLKGMKVAATVWWPGAIHEGGGIMQMYVDAGASPAQRDAMAKILSGEAGGVWGMLSKTYKVLPPKFERIEFQPKGKSSKLKVGGILEAEAEAVLNPVTKEESFFDVVIAKPLITKRMSIFSGRKHVSREVSDSRLSWSYTGKHFGVAKVSHKGP